MGFDFEGEANPAGGRRYGGGRAEADGHAVPVVVVGVGLVAEAFGHGRVRPGHLESHLLAAEFIGWLTSVDGILPRL